MRRCECSPDRPSSVPPDEAHVAVAFWGRTPGSLALSASRSNPLGAIRGARSVAVTPLGRVAGVTAEPASPHHARPIGVIGAPLDPGSGRRGVDMGPSAIRYALLGERIQE